MLGRHKSLDKNLKRSVAWLKTLPEVKRVILGFSECARHRYSPGDLRFRVDVPGGIKLNGYSGKGVTDIYVKVEPIEYRDKLKAIIAERFSKECK